MKKIFLMVLAGVGVMGAGGAEGLFWRWMGGMERLQVRGTGVGELDGNMLCPACAAMHARTIDAVWPMVWAWRRSGDGKWLRLAKETVEWARRNVEGADGSYLNDVNMEWRGTTIFAQASLGKTLSRFGEALDGETRREWEGIFRRQTEWAYRWMTGKGFGPNVNYRAGLALSMELAHRVTGEGKYREGGDAMAKQVLGCIAEEDGMLWGEASPYDGVSGRGFRGVDIGYNAEETIPAMVEWAELRGDGEAMKRLLRTAEAHMDFVLPDGGLDNSFGSRACKWTYWGSRTSDGILPMLAALARHGNKRARRAIRATLGMYRRCTDARTGLLTGGPHYAAAGEPVCIHHTFCHAKTLPGFIEAGVGGGEEEPLLSETAFGLKRYPTCGAATAGVGEWRATASESDMYFGGDNGKSTGGGSMTLLYHRRLGPVLAATMAKWRIVERMNMQHGRSDGEGRCLTPRIESVDGKYTSACDDGVEFAAEEVGGGAVRFRARGRLRGIDDAAMPGRAGFGMEWTVAEGGVRLEARAEGEARLVLPLIAAPGERVAHEGGRVVVEKSGGRLVAVADKAFERVASARADGLAFNSQTGLAAAYFTVGLRGGETVKVEIRAE